MAWTLERAEAEVVHLAEQAHEKDDFCRAAGERIARVLEFDGSCWHTNDPATLLITSHLTERLPDRFELIAQNEYATDDVNHFATLATSRRRAKTLRGATRNRPDTSPRYRDLLAPNGIDAELRAALVAGRSPWGGLILVRHAGRPDFTGEEADFLARLSRPLARGLRTAILASATRRQAGHDAPGLVVIDDSGEIHALSETAVPWLEELGATRPGPPPAVLATAAAARRAAPGHAPVRSRVRTAAGRGAVLHGSRVADAPDRATVIIEPAAPVDIAPLLLGAYGLTDREREVAELVMRGSSTGAVAARLFITPYTVQDHLKAIFEKVGVRSRKQLMAQVFFEHYLPRIADGQSCPSP
jgi:DNA-binding CsgD family transcriptional regulator